MTSCGSAEFKLRWAFRLFDADESGNIELDEMFEIVATFYDMEGEPREPAFEQAEDIFKALDVNGDGSLDEEEFVKGCLEDPDFCRLIQGGVSRLRMEQEYRARVEAEGEKQEKS